MLRAIYVAKRMLLFQSHQNYIFTSQDTTTAADTFMGNSSKEETLQW